MTVSLLQPPVSSAGTFPSLTGHLRLSSSTLPVAPTLPSTLPLLLRPSSGLGPVGLLTSYSVWL